MACPDCASTATTRRKGRTALGYRRFRCQACRRRFNERTGTPFNDLQYPTDIVLLTVLWRLRYKLGFRDVAELLLQRGFEVTHETIRAWEVRFAPLLADQLRAKRRGQAGGSWYLDETYVKVAGRWCATARPFRPAGPPPAVATSARCAASSTGAWPPASSTTRRSAACATSASRPRSYSPSAPPSSRAWWRRAIPPPPSGGAMPPWCCSSSTRCWASTSVPSEDGAFWLAFLRGLVARGLSGVELVTSDAHQGLREAIATVFGGASWQRCRTHFMRNLLTRVPKSAEALVATTVRTIYQQPSASEVHAQHARVVEQLGARFPEAAAMLADAAEEILAFTAFPVAHWRQVWSNNPLERLNKEIRRRTNVVGIFPNRSAVIRLIGAVLSEQHDEWAVGRRYMTMMTLLSPPGSELTSGKEVLLQAAG